MNTSSLDLELSSSQYAYCADSVSLSFTGDITLEAWIKLEQLPSTAGTDFEVIWKFNDETDNRSYRLLISTTDKLQFIYT